MRTKTLFATVIILLALSACGETRPELTDGDSEQESVELTESEQADNDTADGDSESERESEEVVYEYAIKTINMPFAQVIDELPRFEKRGLTLYLNVTSQHLADPDLPRLLRLAKEKSVAVKLWPLLLPEEGAWCNEDTLEKFWANVFAFVDLLDTVPHNIKIIVINSELGSPKIDKIREYFGSGDWLKVVGVIKENIDHAAFAKAQGYVQSQVDKLHRRGYLAQITTYPYLLDDFLDKDPDIQDAANVVLDGVAWDRLAFTPYTAAYSTDFKQSFGPDFVHSYSKMARERYGAKADIALGLIAPGAAEGYVSVSQLAADVAAAKAAGITRLDVFDLQGMLKDDRFDEWADALLTPPAVPPVEGNTADFHESFAIMDQILNSSGHPKTTPRP